MKIQWETLRVYLSLPGGVAGWKVKDDEGNQWGDLCSRAALDQSIEDFRATMRARWHGQHGGG